MIELENNQRVLLQWSLNQRVILDGFLSGTKVEFSVPYDCKDSALPVEAYAEGDHVYANIPNILLQSPKFIRVLVCPSAADTDHTPEEKDFKVVRREKPEDYEYTETPTLSLSNKVDKFWGEANKGKALIIGSDGFVTAGTQSAVTPGDGDGGDCGITYIESTSDDPVVLRTLASGTYVLQGKFTPYTGSTRTISFSSSLLVNIITKTAGTHVQVFYPVNNVVQFLNITDDSYERTDVKLNELQTGLDEVKTTLEEQETAIAGKADADDCIKPPSTASVGQTIVIKSVDETGKPTEWGPVDLPFGNGGGDTLEFIKTIKLTEEVSTIKINTDAEGNPLNLKRIVVAVGTVGGTPNENRSNYWAYPNAINAGAIRTTVNQGVYATGAAVSSVVDIQMITNGVYLLNSSCNSNPKQTWGSYNKEPTIKEINFGVSTADYTFGVNTYFHVMGVKA